MKPISKRFKIALQLIPVIALGVFLFTLSQRAPSEAEMLANFKMHKATFRKLAQMAKSDALDYIPVDLQKFKAVKQLDPARLPHYTSLLKQAEIFAINRDHSWKSTHRFLDNDFGSGSWDKAYVYSSESLMSLASQRGATYSKIEANWYFYRSES